MSVSTPPEPTAAGGAEPDSTVALAERLADELAQRWALGERPSVEDFLTRHPRLAARPDAAVELIYEEMCQAQLNGQSARPSAWYRRFPQWRRQIETLLACHDLLETAGGDRLFPRPGETFGDFELLDEFGRGAHGRVYLARQPALADRPVVLKLASLAGQEHLSLARLQHTHIMPLYWSQDDASLGLRALCMPYFGGAPLSRLLARLADVPPGRRTGRSLVEALAAESENQRMSPPVRGPTCRFLEQASYVDAVCSIGACLADALDYAHERNIVHHDIKPSNVLIAADGQPLLLDFHLAQPPLDAGATAIDWLGGTPGYMAPEHAAALVAMQTRRPIPRRVDGLADVFGLGLLLCEALAGERPPATDHLARWLRGKNNEVSAALADLLAKCVAPVPADRYPSAGGVAADLRRHLAHQPLKLVRNRSLPERWRKWRRRRPYALMALFLTTALVASCAVMIATLRQRRDDAQQALDAARLEMQTARFQAARLTIEHGLSLAAALPWPGELLRDLQTAKAAAERGYRAQRLHALVARLRALYGPRGLPQPETAELEAEAERLWNDRHWLADQWPADNGAIEYAGRRSDMKDDLADLALFWATVVDRRAGAPSAGRAARERMGVLQEAERLIGPRLIFCRELARLARLVGDEQAAGDDHRRAEKLTPVSGWEHYALGRSDLNFGDLADADAHFRAAVAENPKELWPNFYHARAAYELKQYEEAALAFTVCIVLADGAAWTYYNRGLANARLERAEAARRDFDRALALDPQLADAALDRGLLSYHERRYAEAIADLQRASAGGADAAAVAYALALCYAAVEDRANAMAQLTALFALDPNHEGARALADVLRGDESGSHSR